MSSEEDYVTKLLSERLELLLEWKKLDNKSPQHERLISRNKIALIQNANEDELNLLFGENNEQDVTKNIHIINVISLCKIRSTEHKKIQETLDQLLEFIKLLE